VDRARRLSRAAGQHLDRERAELAHRSARGGRAARACLAGERERVRRAARESIRAAIVLVARERERTDGVRRAIAQGARRDLQAARHGTERRGASIVPRALRVLERERERAAARERRSWLVDPRRVVERGYAILRAAGGGRVLRAPADAPPGTAVDAELAGGRLHLRSEGGGEGR
jgi:exodeoxyribonuclease VII large subunit